MNSTYKIIAKLLAMRLDRVIGRVLSGHQGAFIKGRHIQENFLIVHEYLHVMMTQRKKGVVLKLEF